MIRLRAEIASLRVTLGQQPPTEGVEPVGCPLPGMCVMVHDNATIRARVEALEVLVREVLTTRAVDHAEAHCTGWAYRARAALEGNHGAPGHD